MDPDHQKPWVALVDAHPTQLRQLQADAKQHAASMTIILGLMHVLSYLWKAAQVLDPEGSEASSRLGQ